MDETLASSSIRKRLSLQKEVMKWLVEFSDKVEKRATIAAAEINGLLEQAGAVEEDTKKAITSFNNLSHFRLIDHRVSDEDGGSVNMKENARTSTQSQVPAQDYELDILPRYKEALSLGLAASKKHFKSKGHSSSSISRAMSAQTLLPHVIGSEEYTHDNSCGLTDDHTLRRLPDDFSWLRELKGESSNAELPDLFSSQVLGIQQDSNKDETESLVTAARDFKAMLEAALLNPYKFYDDGNVAALDASGDNTSAGMQNNAKTAKLMGAEASPSEGSVQPNIPDTCDLEFYSALVTGSLFDADEESPSSVQKESADIPALAVGSVSGYAGTNDSVIPTDITQVASTDFSSEERTMLNGKGKGVIGQEDTLSLKDDSFSCSGTALPHELQGEFSSSASINHVNDAGDVNRAKSSATNSPDLPCDDPHRCADITGPSNLDSSEEANKKSS